MSGASEGTRRKGPATLRMPTMAIPANMAKRKLTLNCLDYFGIVKYHRTSVARWFSRGGLSVKFPCIASRKLGQ
jgi:hypothetical protein